MTTCVNQEKKGYAGKAVSATLAGVLAVGMVPASALAAVPGGSDVAEDAGVETLATTPQYFASATPTFTGGSVNTTFTFNDAAQYLKISKLTPVQGDTIEVKGLAPSTDGTGFENYTAYYLFVNLDSDKGAIATNTGSGVNVQYTNAKGTKVDVKGTLTTALPEKSGEYAVVACYKADDKVYFNSTAGYFKIEGQALSSATLYDGEDVTDTTFNYDGTIDGLRPSKIAERIGVAIDNVSINDYVNVDIYNVGGTTKLNSNPNNLSSETNLEVGKTYVAKVSGKANTNGDNPYQDQVQDIEFTIGKLDLSTAVVEGTISEKLASDLLAATNGGYKSISDDVLWKAGFKATIDSDAVTLCKASGSSPDITYSAASNSDSSEQNLYTLKTQSYTYDAIGTAGITELGYSVYADDESTPATEFDSSKTYYKEPASATQSTEVKGSDIVAAGWSKLGFTYLYSAANGGTAISAATALTTGSTYYTVEVDKTYSQADLRTAGMATYGTVYVGEGSASSSMYEKASATDQEYAADNSGKYCYVDTSTSGKTEPDYSLAAVKKLLIESINSSDFGDGLDADCLADLIDVSLVSTPKSSIKTVTNDLKGAYTYKISARSVSLSQSSGQASDGHNPIADNKSNTLVTGSTTFTVYNADYAGEVAWNQSSAVNANTTDDSSYKVNISPDDGKEIEYVDLSKIEVKYDNDSKTIKNAKLTITVTDADGKTVDADQLKEPGTYYVSVSYNDEDTSGKVVCASEVKKVVVSYKVDEKNVYVDYNGQNVETSQTMVVTYTGKDFAPSFTYLVKSASGNTLVEGTDYDVVITTTVAGKTQEVTEIVDAGTYKVTIKGKTYNQNVWFNVEVQAANVTSATPTNNDFEKSYDTGLTTTTTTKNDNGEEVKTTTSILGKYIYAYTGDVIVPEYSFKTDEKVKAALTTDDYDVYYVQVADAKGNKVEHQSTIDYTDIKSQNQFSAADATELKDEGIYRVIFKAKDNLNNYTINIPNFYIKVTSSQVFLDVPNGEWYTDYVYAANKQGYVYGYNNGAFFGPNDEITRGDVVVILARMAGITTNGADDQTDQIDGYTNPFADVDNSMYYAKAVAWAAHVGVVTGTSATTFEPERSVTREEFVTMLQRYANLCENGGAVAENATTELAKYTDGTTVCDWAKAAVAWASENEIMTGYAGTTVLDPEGAVTRAQVAKMAVTYQPKKLSSSNLIGSLY